MARAHGPAAASGFSSRLRAVLAVAGVAAAVGYVESCPRVGPGPLDDAVCALQQEATVSLQQRFADRLGAGRGGLAKHAGSALLADGALASSAMEAAQEARARRASAKQEQDAQLLEASAAGTSGAAPSASAVVAASADASKAAAVMAAASARSGETSGVRMPAVTRYDRRRQQPLPKLLDRTLEAMPRLGGPEASSPSHVLSLFSAGAVAAMKSVAPSLFEEETTAQAPAAGAVAQEAAHRDPAAEGADMETRASPGAVQLASRGKRLVAAGKKEKAYYTVESADGKLGKRAGGLAYRLTKSLRDKDVSMKPLAWGTIIRGLDEGDGWLKVDGGYLPFAVSGSSVLALKSEPSAVDIVAASEAATTTCPFSHKDGLLEYLSCLADRCEDWDPSVLKGVTCEETFLPLGCDSDLADALREDASGATQLGAATAHLGTAISAACPALCGLCREPALKKPKPKPADQQSPANHTLPTWVADHDSVASLLQQGTARTVSAAGHGGAQARARAAAGVALYVPSVKAQSVEFDDRDERPGFVKGPVRIRRALDEASLDHYTVWWAARGKRLSAQPAIKLLRKSGEDLQLDLPRTKVPVGAEGLMVVTGNQKGDMRVGPVALFSVQEGPSFGEIFGGFLRGG